MKLIVKLFNFTIFIAMLLLTACSGGQDSVNTEGKINILTTTGMIADMAKNIGGDHVSVTALMGPGVDPHLYKASAGDISRLNRADIVFYNGLFLEGKMVEIMEKIAAGGKTTVALGEAVSKDLLRKSEVYKGHPDPHIWFNVEMWASTIDAMVDSLSKAKVEAAEDFRANAAAYRADLEQLHQYCREQISLIPENQQMMITAHDAFGYFGAAYNIEVLGLQGINTSSEYGIKDIERLVNLIVERKTKAVFVESSVPKRSIEAVVEGCKARGHGVVIGGQLFSDAMGEDGTPEGTYIGMVRHNVDTIVSSLK